MSRTDVHGQRVTIEGVEYVVNRVTVQSKTKTHTPGRGEAPERPTRAQIDLIPVAEAELRRDRLAELLAGGPVPGDEPD